MRNILTNKLFNKTEKLLLPKFKIEIKNRITQYIVMPLPMNQNKDNLFRIDSFNNIIQTEINKNFLSMDFTINLPKTIFYCKIKKM